MNVIVKVVLTIVVFATAISVINTIKDGTDFNPGLFMMIIVAGSIAGVITIWSYKQESIEN